MTYNHTHVKIYALSTSLLVHSAVLFLLFFKFKTDNSVSMLNITSTLKTNTTSMTIQKAAIFLQNSTLSSKKSSKSVDKKKSTSNQKNKTKVNILSLKNPSISKSSINNLFNLTKATTKFKPKTRPNKVKTISLPELTRSFLKQDYLNAQKGNKDHPSNEQIKREHYARKIQKCLYSSFNINKHKLTCNLPIKAPLKLYLEFHKTGILKDVKLIEPTGIPEIDAFALKICKDASKSFPPIPKFFQQAECKVITFLTIYPAQKKGTLKVVLI